MSKYEELKTKAVELGLELKGKPSTEDLENMIAVKEAELAESKELEEMEKKEKTFEKPEENAKNNLTSAEERAQRIKEYNRMVIANITPLDERMRTLPSEMYSVMTEIGTKKQVVKFGKDQLVFKVIVDMLKEKEALLQTKQVVNGKEVTKHVMGKRFAIIEREPTEEEIQEILG